MQRTLSEPPDATSGRIVLRNFVALGSGEAAARLVAFAATVYVARALGPGTYGIIGFATALMLYISRFVDGGIELTGVREVAEDRGRIASLAPSILAVRVLVAAALALVLAVAGIFLLPQPDGVVLALYGLTLFPIGASTRWIYVGLERTRLIALARACGEVAMAGLVVALVRGPEHLTHVPLAQFVGDSLAALILLHRLRAEGTRLPLELDWRRVEPYFRRSWPLVLSALLGLMIFNSDLIFLRFFRDTTTVGYYAAAYTLIGFLTNLGLAYRMSLLPTLTRLGSAADRRRALHHTAYAHVFAVTFPLAVGGAVLAPGIIGGVFGAGYEPSGTALRLLIWTIPLSLLRDVAVVALLAVGREPVVLRVTAWATAVNLVLNLALIPPLGMTGAALATIATETVRMVLALAHSRAHGFPFLDVARLSRPLLAGLAMAGLLIAVGPAAFWIAIPLGAAAYAIALAALGGVQLRRGRLPALRV